VVTGLWPIDQDETPSRTAHSPAAATARQVDSGEAASLLARMVPTEIVK
jgi:hypothetical protein